MIILKFWIFVVLIISPAIICQNHLFSGQTAFFLLIGGVWNRVLTVEFSVSADRYLCHNELIFP